MGKHHCAYDEDVPDGHPSQETRALHVTDIELRAAGFKIEHRPRRGEPVWSRGTVKCVQSVAEELLRRDRKRR